jgi:hypothetical protein
MMAALPVTTLIQMLPMMAVAMMTALVVMVMMMAMGRCRANWRS